MTTETITVPTPSNKLRFNKEKVKKVAKFTAIAGAVTAVAIVASSKLKNAPDKVSVTVEKPSVDVKTTPKKV